MKYKSLGTLEAYGETFGQCIIGMRSRIMRVLDKEVGKNSILECYNQAESCWEAILKCGSDLMNYKTMAELIEKQ